MTNNYTSAWRDEEVTALGDLADKFFAKEVSPHRERWEAQHRVDREVWTKAGELGLLCCSIPEEYGGGGGSFAHDLAVLEAQARALDSGFGNTVHSGIVAHYILAYGTEQQRRRWLPEMASGKAISRRRDDRARRRVGSEEHQDDCDPGRRSLCGQRVEDVHLQRVDGRPDRGGRQDRPRRGRQGCFADRRRDRRLSGLSRGRVLDKVGQHGADTSELSFTDVRVPVD